MVRPVDVTGCGSWGRFDVPGGRTIYSAQDRRTAYCEVIAYVAPKVGVAPVRLSDVFDDTDGGDPTLLLEAITREWEERFRITPNKIVAGWRDARCVYPVALPPDGWYIDIEHAETIRVFNRELATEIAAFGVNRITREHVLGERRDITVALAEWIHKLVLFDGSLPHGIRFTSKHGANGACWATWLRRMDDGNSADAEPTKAAPGQPILTMDQDADLRWAAETMKIKFL